MDYQIIILAAGQGKRMGNPNLPKVLFQLSGKPMISRLAAEMKKIKPENETIVVIGHRGELIKNELGKDYVYALQTELRGTGDAARAAADFLKAKNALVLYGDMPLIKSESVKQLASEHERKNNLITMFTVTVPNFEGQYGCFNDYGRIARDAQGRIERIVEYRDASDDERKITEVNPSLFIFDSRWLKDNLKNLHSHNAQKELYLTDLVELLQDKNRLGTLPIDFAEGMGINTPEQLVFAEKILKLTE